MQSNPISRHLFFLAVERFLDTLRHSLFGIKHSLENSLSIDTKTLAFADDIVVFLHKDKDIFPVKQAIQEFFIASNSGVNVKTSILYDFEAHYSQDIHPMLSFPVKHYDLSTFKYLGFPNQNLDCPPKLGNSPRCFDN